MKNFPNELQHGSGAVMSLDRTRLLLAFREPSDRKTVAAMVRELELVLEEDSDERRQPETINHTPQRYWVRTADNRELSDDRYQAIVSKAGNFLEWAGPVYRFANVPGRGGFLTPLPDVVLVKPAFAANDETRRRLDEQMRRFGLRDVKEKSAYLSSFRYYKLDNPAQVSSYQVIPQLLRNRDWWRRPTTRTCRCWSRSPLFRTTRCTRSNGP
jgi:hypothetical protein